MTQPISSGVRWQGADLTCSESREEPEPLTCEEPRDVSCASERAHRIAASAPRDTRAAEMGPRDAGAAAPTSIEGTREGSVPVDTVAPPGLAFCRDADTVVEGFLCNDPAAVSHACRKPTHAFDEFVCDDLRMQRLQWAVLRETWTFVKTLLLAMVRAKP